MRLVILGTKDFAVPTFLALCDSEHEVVALVTQPDRPQGRKQEVVQSLIARSACERKILVEQPLDVNASGSVERLRELAPDLLVTAAYGQILSAEVLGIARHGAINLHGSILPSYRGAAPVARAIQDGRVETGVTVIRMTPRIDAGGMIAVARTPIGPDETAGEVEHRLAEIGAPLIVQTVNAIQDGNVEAIPQTKAKVTRAPKLRKEDAAIAWTLPAQSVHDHIRAMRPWPIASTTWRPAEGKRPTLRVIVHESAVVEGDGPPGSVLEAARDRLVVAAGSGAVRLMVVQIPGKKPVPIATFLNGYPIQPGDRMGES